MRVLLALALLVYATYACTGGALGTDKIFGPPETLPLERYDDIDVNVFFWFASGTEVYLGKTRGASSCGAIASGYAYERGANQSDWSYVCCTVEDGSECYRKIR